MAALPCLQLLDPSLQLASAIRYRGTMMVRVSLQPPNQSDHEMSQHTSCLTDGHNINQIRSWKGSDLEAIQRLTYDVEEHILPCIDLESVSDGHDDLAGLTAKDNQTHQLDKQSAEIIRTFLDAHAIHLVTQ